MALEPIAVRPDAFTGLAAALGLADPGASWHAERDGVAAFGAWMAGAGGSSTMPQKQNPVGPAVLVALSRQVAGLSAVLTGAGIHHLQRDGAAWFTEWLALPQMCLSTGRALGLALDIISRTSPEPTAMAQGLNLGQGTLVAKALTFVLARLMPRPEGAAKVAALSLEALAGGAPLLTLAARDFRQTDWALQLTGTALMGAAPAEARAFARSASQ